MVTYPWFSRFCITHQIICVCVQAGFLFSGIVLIISPVISPSSGKAVLTFVMPCPKHFAGFYSITPNSHKLFTLWMTFSPQHSRPHLYYTDSPPSCLPFLMAIFPLSSIAIKKNLILDLDLVTFQASLPT